MKSEIYPHDLTNTIRRRVARRRLLNTFALAGKLALLLLLGRALAALIVQDAHTSPWIILATLLALLWGAWSIAFTLR